MGDFTPGTPGLGTPLLDCCANAEQPNARSPAIQRHPLCDDVMDHLAGRIGKPEVAPAVSIGQLQMVDAEQIENGGGQVVHVNRLLNGLVSEVVGGAVCHAALDSATGEP